MNTINIVNISIAPKLFTLFFGLISSIIFKMDSESKQTCYR